MVSKAAPKGTKEMNDLSFEEILSRLDRVVKDLEKGDTPLEKSLSTFEEGIRLSRLGSSRLDEAERRIEILLNNENGVETRPLDKEPDAQ
jgi:exodeoxyribonuclease VII small subunit